MMPNQNVRKQLYFSNVPNHWREIPGKGSSAFGWDTLQQESDDRTGVSGKILVCIA